MKTWKTKEKTLTEWLSLQELWPAERKSRALRGEAVEDIAWGPISIELKTRKSPPQYLTDWLEQAKLNAEGKVPLVVVHGDRMRMGEQICMLTLTDLLSLLKGVKNAG